MRFFKIVVSVVLPFFMLAIAGCGSSGSGGSTDWTTTPPVTPGTGTKTTTIFGSISTATGRTGIAVSTDRASIDVNGQVVVTARVVNNGSGLSGVPVTFSITAPLNGTATIDAALTTVTTDSNGTAITRVTTGNTLSTTNVIVSATVAIGAQTATANTTFQIVRGTGVISFSGIPPLSATINPGLVASKTFQQPIQVTLTDSNGNPRVGAPVTMSVYTNSGTSSVTFTQATVTTDASGTAIFNATITMAAPYPELVDVDSIIFKAVTADANPIVGYAAGYFTVTSDSTAVTEPVITLTTDRTSYDINDLAVLATAKVVKNGTALSGVPVTFSIIAPANGSATIETGFSTVTTDSNGFANSRLSSGFVLSTTNVIIMATATVGLQTVNATAIFQIVRGSGVIMFTSSAGMTPGGQTNLLAPISKEVDPALIGSWAFMQLIPFKVTDSNGNPRVGVPVTLSVYSITSAPGDVLLVPPVADPTQQSFTTDSAGQGIFNVMVFIATPPAGGVNTVDVVFKAVTSDATPVIAYVGNSYSLSAKAP
jgi:hypothetical protein